MKKNHVIIAIIITFWILGYIYSNVILNIKSEEFNLLEPLDINYEDSFNFEIKGVNYNRYLHAYTLNNNYSLGNNFHNYLEIDSKRPLFLELGRYKMLNKKAQNDTLIALSKENQVVFFTTK